MTHSERGRQKPRLSEFNLIPSVAAIPHFFYQISPLSLSSSRFDRYPLHIQVFGEKKSRDQRGNGYPSILEKSLWCPQRHHQSGSCPCQQRLRGIFFYWVFFFPSKFSIFSRFLNITCLDSKKIFTLFLFYGIFLIRGGLIGYYC